MIQRRVLIAGRVQGVGFRASTIQAVQKYPNLKGFVRNLPDGRVEALFAGTEKEVLAMAAWCKNGPPTAQVTSLEIKEEVYDSTLKEFGRI